MLAHLVDGEFALTLCSVHLLVAVTREETGWEADGLHPPARPAPICT